MNPPGQDNEDIDRNIIISISDEKQFGDFLKECFYELHVLFPQLGFSDEETCRHILENAGIILVDGEMLNHPASTGRISEVLLHYADSCQVGAVPAFVFVGFPFGREFEEMKNLLEGSGHSSKDLIVMCRIGEGIAFVLDLEAPEWVEYSVFRLKNCLSEGIAAESDAQALSSPLSAGRAKRLPGFSFHAPVKSVSTQPHNSGLGNGSSRGGWVQCDVSDIVVLSLALPDGSWHTEIWV
jgi:hypothetical protein